MDDGNSRYMKSFMDVHHDFRPCINEAWDEINGMPEVHSTVKNHKYVVILQLNQVELHLNIEHFCPLLGSIKLISTAGIDFWRVDFFALTSLQDILQRQIFFYHLKVRNLYNLKNHIRFCRRWKFTDSASSVRDAKTFMICEITARDWKHSNRRPEVILQQL